VVGW
jgi:hypothetical protein